MLYVQLDTNWPDHPKIMEAGYECAGLWLTAVCRFAVDGQPVPLQWSPVVERCLDVDLLRHYSPGLYVPDLDLAVIIDDGQKRRWIPVALRREVMERDGFVCLVCGSENDLSLDHIVPYSHGGPDTVENLRVLCRPCNSRRGNRV